MISDDNRAAIMSLRFEAEPRQHHRGHLRGPGRARPIGCRTAFRARQASVGGEAYNDNRPGLSLAEGIGVLVALVVLVITLGSLRAAGMPLLTAVLGVGITMVVDLRRDRHRHDLLDHARCWR